MWIKPRSKHYLIVLCLLLCISLAVITTCQPIKKAELTIIRNEENGFMNIVPVTVIIDDGKYQLLTKESVNLKMEIPLGKHKFLIEYPNPYRMEEKKTIVAEVEITGKPRFVILQPSVLKDNPTAYTGDWELMFTETAPYALKSSN